MSDVVSGRRLVGLTDDIEAQMLTIPVYASLKVPTRMRVCNKRAIYLAPEKVNGET